MHHAFSWRSGAPSHVLRLSLPFPTVSVFKLVKEEVQGDGLSLSGDATALVSVSLQSEGAAAESASTAHERDAAFLRDRLAEEVRVRYAEDAAASSVSTTVPPVVSRGGRGGAATKKATTAANFFAAKKKTDTKKSAPATGGNKKKKAAPPAVAKREVEKKKPAKKSPGSKENKEPMEEVGNADDFVGDADEDDDEDDDVVMEETETKPEQPVGSLKKKKNKKKKSPEKKKAADVDTWEDDEPEKVTGAMDAFAVQQPDPTKKKRRRKKLVTKTTVDASGYLHTEQQEVWEDVPSDEEPEPPHPSLVSKIRSAQPQGKKKKAAGSKQTNLMGFFEKK
jgi:hypothetical protein